MSSHKSGFVNIIGNRNVGKSPRGNAGGGFFRNDALFANFCPRGTVFVNGMIPSEPLDRRDSSTDSPICTKKKGADLDEKYKKAQKS